MSIWTWLLPAHRACCDSANDAHTDLAVMKRRLDKVQHELDVLQIQFDEQVLLNVHLMQFLEVLEPRDLS